MFVASAAAEGSARTGSRRGYGQRLYLHRVPCARVSLIPIRRPARAAGCQVAPALRRTGSGRGQPRQRCGQEEFPHGQRWGRRCRGVARPGAGQGCGAGMRDRLTPRPPNPALASALAFLCPA